MLSSRRRGKTPKDWFAATVSGRRDDRGSPVAHARIVRKPP